ncbi:MAG: LamG domain-containing protein, partial [SAR202 cluster bacterium]|nr:LamG domain-containing protein [SAR202 cluster bacterium]
LVGEKDTKIGACSKDTVIGCHPNPTNYFQGMIDDVAIFDAALGDVEISKIATAGLGGTTPVFPADKLATKWSEIRSSN